MADARSADPARDYSLFGALPVRTGHFRLESGYHTDTWLELDALFVDPVKIAPAVTMLAGRLRRHACDAVCGPMVGGAFLAQALATALRTCFFYTQPVPTADDAPLFAAEYRLPGEMTAQAAGSSVAVVDDVISAGSSVRATIAALEAAGASIVVVGTLLALGDVGARHFAERQLPLEALARREFAMWRPAECPLCHAGAALTVPSIALDPR
jgi:orotate phosphoribosyltransferase